MRGACPVCSLGRAFADGLARKCIDGGAFKCDNRGWHDHGLLPVGLGDVSLHGVKELILRVLGPSH